MRRLLALLAATLLIAGLSSCTSDSSSDESTADTSGSTAASDDSSTTTEGGDADGGGGDREAYVQATIESFQSDDFPAGDDEVRCMAEGVVDAVGVGTLQDAGVSPEQFGTDGPSLVGDEISQDQADEIGATMVGCLEDPVGLFAQAFAGEDDPETTACLEENLDEDTLVQLFSVTLLLGQEADPPPEFMTLFGELAAACPGLANATTGSP